jgi:hypothetical protein
MPGRPEPEPDPRPPLISAVNALRRAWRAAKDSGDSEAMLELEDLGARAGALLARLGGEPGMASEVAPAPGTAGEPFPDED